MTTQVNVVRDTTNEKHKEARVCTRISRTVVLFYSAEGGVGGRIEQRASSLHLAALGGHSVHVGSKVGRSNS